MPNITNPRLRAMTETRNVISDSFHENEGNRGRELFPGLLRTGFLNDFCEQEKEILRTDDICHDCMETLKTSFDRLILQQVLDIFEGVRTRLLFN